MRILNMIRFWNSKKRSLFRQSTALIVAGALLFSTILPPLTYAKSMGGNHLRKTLFTVQSKEFQTRTFERYKLEDLPRATSHYPPSLIKLEKRIIHTLSQIDLFLKHSILNAQSFISHYKLEFSLLTIFTTQFLQLLIGQDYGWGLGLSIASLTHPVPRKVYKWRSRVEALENVSGVLKIYQPRIMEQYEKLDQLAPNEIQDLKEEIYKITTDHFGIWGLSRILTKKPTFFKEGYIDILKEIFQKLDLNPFGFRLDWSSEKQGIASVRYILLKEIPQIMEKYDRFNQLSYREIESLKNQIYRITSHHFRAWALNGALDKKKATYFHGKHGEALRAVFSHLNLTPLGFELKWKNKKGEPDINVGIESVKFVLYREIPHIMEQYQKIGQLGPREIQSLRNQIYGIKDGHFRVWKLSEATNKRVSPYFNGSYKNVLIAVFDHPKLDLRLQGFKDYRRATFQKKYSWNSSELGISNVKEAITNNRPDIMELYEHLNSLSESEKEDLGQKIYEITSSHLQLWGVVGAINKRVAPYFEGKHSVALMAVFHDLNLNPLGFRLHWSTENEAIESVRYVLTKEVPHILDQYKKIHQMSGGEIQSLRNQIYRITDGLFRLWGLGRAFGVSHFKGTYIKALKAVFPDLNLNPLGFQLDWSSEKNGIASVRYVLSKEIPHIIEQYERIEQLSPNEIENLRNQIYQISSKHIGVWELGKAQSAQSAPYFNGNYKEILLKVFSAPQLGLTREGFVGKTSSSPSTDILEPLLQPQKRFKTVWQKVAYYLFVSSWEESVFRWGGWVAVPLYLSSIGIDLTLIVMSGLIINIHGFLFGHTIVRWIAKRNSNEWSGWKLELKKDLFSTRAFDTLLYNILFLSVLSIHPASISIALGTVIILHLYKDMIHAYSESSNINLNGNLAKEITFIAQKLKTSPKKLKWLLANQPVSLSNILDSILSFWEEKVKDMEIYVVDLESAKGKNDRLLQLRTIQQIEAHKKKNPSKKVHYLFVNKNNQTAQEIEKVLKVKGTLATLKSAEEAVLELKERAKNESFSLKIITTQQSSEGWANILSSLAQHWNIKMIIPQILNIGKEVSINLLELETMNPELKEWAENLKSETEVDIEGNRLTIHGVPLEPPTQEEILKINQLYNQQA